MSEALEITTFAPAGDHTGADFVAANADIDDYLRRQPGFRWRRTTVRDDGIVVDIVAWGTRGEAESAARGITTEMGGSPVHSRIDQGTVDWQIVEVLHSL
ncbi:hypothetical protein ACFFQW_24660 [Umezawaea endophytica]|uniref:ABM domain-containing protein n=1 Tax=Umezawaea endophytica TaxID=1654476 RepID=A0A9X2VFT8_9PSEU|nr:hypothetical protein [Umezawaea endophytica]MCS7475796.1 hypothetical protein [Umezawaea endophytica]